MAARVIAAALVGIDAKPVVVEVDVAHGLRAFSIVGLPDSAVKESKERIVAALKNVGKRPPSQLAKRVTVNLAPADIKKHGPSYDLAIALGFLIASGQLQAKIERALFVGELSLEGRVRPVRGVLAAALMAKRRRLKTLFVPAKNAAEAALVEGLTVFGLRSIVELIEYFEGARLLEPAELAASAGAEGPPAMDLAHISGQPFAKRALEIAAAGGHNLLFHGPPGAGKTLLAKALPGILPPLNQTELLEVIQIYSASGQPFEKSHNQRPFRNPHHQTSPPAVLGGGSLPEPGEVTLAHQGVLFLDELPEFRRDVLEGLRQPLEEGKVHVSRAQGRATFPARFMLVAAMNPCPCGFQGDSKVPCRCSMMAIQQYQRKVSGPILDRFDLHVAVPRLTKEELLGDSVGEASAAVRERVSQARQRQAARLKDAGHTLNSALEGKFVKKFCALEPAAQGLIERAIDSYALSARSYHKVLKVSRTIADLAASDIIKREHVGEALQYRQPLNPRA